MPTERGVLASRTIHAGEGNARFGNLCTRRTGLRWKASRFAIDADYVACTRSLCHT